MRIRDLLREDEYDQFDQAKDPNLRNVDARSYYTTSKADQIFWKPGDKEMWQGRQVKLLARCKNMYAKLQNAMPASDRPALKGIPIDVPFNGVSAWAQADYVRRVIEVDLGCFWDLSDDCLAYTIGHEIGHHVYNYKKPNYWKRDATAAQNRKYEMDADVYGALIAYELGYDRRKAFDLFTVAMQREPFSPKDTYPSVDMRRKNIEKGIAQKKQQQQKPAEPQADPTPDKEQKDAWLRHIMNGMQKFEVALANNPDIQLA